MPTPSPTETDTSLPSTVSLPPPASAPASVQAINRPIYAFFGGNPSASSSSSSSSLQLPAAPPAVPKRKRKKAEDASVGTQARLSLAGSGGEGKAWSLGKPETEQKGVAGTNGSAVGGHVGKGAGGEEEELREMSKRGGGGKERGKGRGKRKADAGEGSGAAGRAAGAPGALPGSDDMLIDPSILTHGESNAEQTSSPVKRKRGRPRKSQQPNSSSIDHPSASHPTIISSSPIAIHVQAGPSVATSKPRAPRHSDDFVITSCSVGPSRTNGGVGLARTASRGLAPDDAIEIDEHHLQPVSSSPAKPKKIAFAADSKPTHSFFSRLEPDGGRSRASSVASDTVPKPPLGDVPKAVDGGMIQKEKRAKQPHAFLKFAGGGSGVSGLKNGWGKEEWNTPLPGGDWPSHASVDQLLVKEGNHSGSSRRPKRVLPYPEDDTFWSLTGISDNLTQHPGSPSTSSTIPFITQHPAFTSIPAKAKSSSANRDAWCDRYRPLRSSEVLSNELETTYLRDWLSTLAVGHHEGKTPKVVRRVRRAKARSALVEGWIVDDLGLYGEPLEDGETSADEVEELEELEEPEISPDFDKRPNEYPPLESRLTNTIMLNGPHGAGKTAAVYAAAHELGWDVFEVYPGIGKRTGGNLMSWVGDVGRNHMVANGGKEDGAEGKKPKVEKEKKGAENGVAGGIKSFFGSGAAKSKLAAANGTKKTNIELGSQGSAAEPIDIAMHDGYDHDDTSDDDDRPILLGPPTPKASGFNEAVVVTDTSAEPTKVRQSLILIDEADILFEEEATFWPAVISLIAESRRPVVLTCNDLKRIPKDQLPLQAILQYRPPPLHIAIPYLQAIAAQEAKSLPDLDAIVRESTHRGQDELMDQPLPPNGNERLPYFDLRRAISQLQLERGPSHPWDLPKQPPQEGRSDLDNLKGLLRRFDAVSYADAHVDLRPWAKMEIIDIDRVSPCTDDEMGIHALIKPEIRESYPVLAGYDRSSDIAQSLIDLAGGRMGPLGNLNVDRARYIRSTLPVLDPLIPLSSPLLPHSSLFLHTLPTILQIVEVDNLLELAENEAIQRGEERINRKTGRPVRGGGGYMRWLELDDEVVAIARGLSWAM
ncbi:hypothetical protein CI109_101863 [Kwoniella shandongensis]|uniref:AAA+ ATPase domain-containing protein n=1 Tax=Kwoniella shandongensis TaxID=1734106 RepID=A0A5M6BP00_9TREE|nr:uncharacterized protein CI109_007059 [Kwoniella shandongensis]KAA5524624.1 hypothetical protein CI109_007059 [Kwoniella shandongensis]